MASRAFAADHPAGHALVLPRMGLVPTVRTTHGTGHPEGRAPVLPRVQVVLTIRPTHETSTHAALADATS